jgi:flagellar basal body-associated protein FliL
MTEPEKDQTKQEPKKSKKTLIAIISTVVVLILVGGGFLAYQFIFIPAQVNAYRNDVVDIHNKMIETIDEMNDITDALTGGAIDSQQLDKYVELADEFNSLIKDLESIEKLDRKNEALEDFNIAITSLTNTAKNAEQVERDIVTITQQIVAFNLGGSDIVSAIESADPEKPDSFDPAMKAYDEGLFKCREAIKNLEAANVSSLAKQAQADTIEYLNEILKAYQDMKKALEKSNQATQENNYNLAIEAVDDIEEIGQRIDNTPWPAGLETLLAKEGEAVSALNNSIDGFSEYDQALMEEYGITE